MKTLFSFQSIRGRLNVLGILVCTGFILAGGIGILATNVTQESLKRAYQNRLVPLRLLKVVSESYSSAIPNAIARMNNGELTSTEGFGLIQASRDSIQRCLREYRHHTLSEREKAVLQDLQGELETADQEIEGLIRMLEIFQAQGKGLLSNQLSMVLHSLDPVVRPLSERLDTLTQIQMDLASQEYRNSETRFTNIVFLLIAIILILLGILFLAGMKMQKHIMSQLQLTLPALEAIGRGDLRIQIDTSVNDEFSDIADGVNDMAHSLRTLVGRLAHSSSHLAECASQFQKLSENISRSSRTNATNSNLTSLATGDASHGLAEISKNLFGIGESVERLVAQMEKARQGVHHANQIGKDGANQALQASAEIVQAENVLQQSHRYAADLNAMLQLYLQNATGSDHLRKRMDDFIAGISSALQCVHNLNIHQASLAANARRISDSIQGVHEVFDGSYQMLQTLHISSHGAARDMQESSKALTRIASTAEQSRESAVESAKEIVNIQGKAGELKVLSEDLGRLAKKFRIAD